VLGRLDGGAVVGAPVVAGTLLVVRRGLAVVGAGTTGTVGP
jgi:hypothetical protein